MIGDSPTDLLLPSVLDRLLNEASDDERSSQRLDAIKAAVTRDLEAFLNTHRRCISFAYDLTELNRSVVDYGLEDFTGANMTSDQNRERFRAEVEAAIRRYEPRFAMVEVIVIPNDSSQDRTLRFRIEGALHAEPAPEPLVQDSMVDPVTNQCEVKESSDG